MQLCLSALGVAALQLVRHGLRASLRDRALLGELRLVFDSLCYSRPVAPQLQGTRVRLAASICLHSPLLGL